MSCVIVRRSRSIAALLLHHRRSGIAMPSKGPSSNFINVNLDWSSLTVVSVVAWLSVSVQLSLGDARVVVVMLLLLLMLVLVVLLVGHHRC